MCFDAASHCSADTACICNSVTFQQAATSCVMQVCSASDAEAAVAYFGSLCPSAAPLAPGEYRTFKLHAFKTTHRACGLTKPSPAASASTSPVTSPSQAALSSPTDIFSNSTTSASLQQIGSTVEKEGPQKTITISSQPISNAPTPPSSSSSSGSATASPPARASPSEASPSSSPLSSNAAATPRRAATLVAGGIGALFAVAV